jgi:NAD(P)-dependent dehydrogenase (short-subunit alcohol dehydrogenase family)
VDDLTGKVAVVTGGATGVGQGLASALAEQGMRLVVADLDQVSLDQAVAELEDSGAEAIGVRTDVADASAVARLRDATFAHLGTVHVLCNNAGIGRPRSLREPIDVNSWREVFAVDLESIVHGLNAFLPRMLEQGEGHIVNTSSRQGLVPTPDLGAYPPAKAASVALSEMLRMELDAAGAPVGVTVLTPGGVRTRGMAAELARYESGARVDDVMHEFLAARYAAGVEPIELGQLVVRAIRGNVLYVNTHQETIEWLEQRVARIRDDAAALGMLR